MAAISTINWHVGVVGVAWISTVVSAVIAVVSALSSDWPQVVVVGSLAVLGWFVTGVLRATAGSHD